jgi:hypothetical protein
LQQPWGLSRFADEFRIFVDGANDFTLVIMESKRLIQPGNDKTAKLTIKSNRIFDYRFFVFTVIALLNANSRKMIDNVV